MMTTMCVLACLEERVQSIMALSRIDPLWISPHPLAHTDGISSDPPPPRVFNPENLVGRFFLMDKQEDGQQFRVQIVNSLKIMSPR
jgi:hypothetical protein